MGVEASSPGAMEEAGGRAMMSCATCQLDFCSVESANGPAHGRRSVLVDGFVPVELSDSRRGFSRVVNVPHTGVETPSHGTELHHYYNQQQWQQQQQHAHDSTHIYPTAANIASTRVASENQMFSPTQEMDRNRETERERKRET
eukprot:CAMPEP_0173096670 /NCGR_PEP_ID=MMETSP1102-20130122/33170_1 /TAXON_ID=49646 /ORGANISM="Geminigera sp., Strain Caron Lab Isolate" /LENGTH=143 /DNA_ID=CAMNT_0013987813 /DNA_START=16 /DNA_END=444 /DNA_ORIENTATION=-